MEQDIIKYIGNPEKTALVIWDVQKILVEHVFNKDEFLNNTKFLIAQAREHNIPVFFTKITLLPEKFESPARRLMMKQRTRNFQFTAEGLELAIEPEKEDIIILKNTASIFIGTNFEMMIRNIGIDTLIFTGIATEYGVESSARDAMNRGFYTIIAKDAVSSSNKEGHLRSLENMKQLVFVFSSKEISDMWK